MKLLYIHHSNINPEKANSIQILQMCKAFSRVGIDVTLAFPSNKTKKEATKDIESLTGNKPIFKIVPFENKKYLKRFSLIGPYFSLVTFLKSQTLDYDVYYLRNPVLINATLKYNLPTVFEAHQPRVHNESKFIDWFLKKNLIRNSRNNKLIKFVTISAGLGNFWSNQGVPKSKIIDQHDAVDISLFSSKIPQEELKKSFKLPLNKKIVTYAGKIEPNRGIENIIKLAQKIPYLYFIVVGGPNERKILLDEKIERLKLNNIRFEGQVPHYKIKNYLFASDILLMVWTKTVKHIQYFSPLKMFEYMATGKIIVGHGFTTINEVLINGENAYLANPDSFEDLKDKLIEAASNPDAIKLGSKAKELVTQKYTWEKRAKNIIDSFEDTLQKN